VVAVPGASEYRMEAFFEGSSVFFGYQAGLSYKINDLISVFAGVRYVTAKNTYNGYLRNIELNYGGAWTPATDIFNGFASQASGASASMQPLVDAIPSLTFAEAEGAGAIDAITRATLEGGLLAFGVSQDMIDMMTLEQAQGTYNTIAQENTATATLLADKKADVEQTATGITPILGVNISPSENLNIGLKYEFATKLEFENSTKEDILTGFDETTGAPITMFPDGQKFRGDMPAMLSAGIDYSIGPKLRLSLGTHYYFDKAANYGKMLDGEYVSNEEVIEDNFFEVAGGLEFDVTDNIILSAGYLHANTGVKDNYQSDLSYSLTTHTLGAGGAYRFNDNVMLNLGVGYTMYVDGEVTIDHEFVDGSIVNAIETYDKSNLFIAVGLDFSF